MVCDTFGAKLAPELKIVLLVALAYQLMVALSETDAVSVTIPGPHRTPPFAELTAGTGLETKVSATTGLAQSLITSWKKP